MGRYLSRETITCISHLNVCTTSAAVSLPSLLSLLSLVQRRLMVTPDMIITRTTTPTTLLNIIEEKQ